MLLRREADYTSSTHKAHTRAEMSFKVHEAHRVFRAPVLSLLKEVLKTIVTISLSLFSRLRQNSHTLEHVDNGTRQRSDYCACVFCQPSCVCLLTVALFFFPLLLYTVFLYPLRYSLSSSSRRLIPRSVASKPLLFCSCLCPPFQRRRISHTPETRCNVKTYNTYTQKKK